MQRDHWDELFDEMYLQGYAERFDEAESVEEAQEAVALAGVDPPAEILDAPTGFGRHAIPLAAAGFRVTGLDRSPVLLDEARRRAGSAEWPKWAHGDFRELPFEDGSFDAVLNLFTAIGYRGENEDRRMLAEFLRVLRQGAPLVIETLHRDRLMTIFQQRGWEPIGDDVIVAEERRFDHVAGEVETDHIVLAGGERRSITFRLRVYTATELARILEEVGYAEVECFGAYDRGALTRESRLVVRAVKPS
jgi:ubiquinone/menaquinone biosynthesis C-methylase UbiE